MSIKSLLGTSLVALLFLIAGVAAVGGVATVGTVLVYGLTAPRVVTIMVAFGLALVAGFFGYFLRKLLAGQVLSSDADTSVAYRGGQGGM